jgi:hypothetical protein
MRAMRRLVRQIGPEETGTRAAASWQIGLQRQLARLPAELGCVVLSSEHLHSRVHGAEEIARLRAVLAPFCGEIRSLVWLRRELSWQRAGAARQEALRH